MNDARGRLPDFVIAGAMRSGTTSLTRYLDAHPDVFLGPKELGFFTEHYDEGVDWYRSRFSEAGDARLCGESTADYFARGDALLRLKALLPDVHVVATLRNPVDRAWSHYWLQKERGKDSRSFEEAIDFELSAIARDGPSAEGIFYVFHGLYDVQLEHALELFSPDRMTVIIFERMVEDPVSVYQTVCRRLGVDDAVVPEIVGQQINPYVQFRSLTVRSLSHRLPGVMRKAVARLNTRRQVAYPEVPRAAQEQLSEFFAPRIERVESILGETLDEWR